MKGLLTKEVERVRHWSWPRMSGRVTHVIGMIIESLGPEVCVGEICYVFGKHGKKIPCQVVGFKEHKVLLMALNEISPIPLGAEVFPSDEIHQVPVSFSLCGRVLDALGNPIDGKGPLEVENYYPVIASPPRPLERERINEILVTGIKAIDGFITLGRGQRIGVISQAGVGKSTLLGMICRQSVSDINVIALIGERGREVKEFIEKDLGKEGLKRSVVIVATADQPAALRHKGAHLATAIAEYFRDCGQNVLLIMDSLTRFAVAVREVGLAIGELPTPEGYPPSLYGVLPILLERVGKTKKGSITGIYSILAESEEYKDHLSEYFKSLLDGHIYLSKKFSHAYHFPPIDILQSLSRLIGDIVPEQQLKTASHIRDLLSAYYEVEELIQVGAYVPGTNEKADKAREKKEAIFAFLKQDLHATCSLESTQQMMNSL